jgi:hypothetical protein
MRRTHQAAIGRACAALIAGDVEHIHAAEQDVAELIEQWTKSIFGRILNDDETV